VLWPLLEEVEAEVVPGYGVEVVTIGVPVLAVGVAEFVLDVKATELADEEDGSSALPTIGIGL
jgi:hypothetical protein